VFCEAAPAQGRSVHRAGDRCRRRAVLFVFRLPSVTFPEPYLFLALLAVSILSAGLKVTLPLPTSTRPTVSVSYALDFASLILIGPHTTMIVAATGVFSQNQLDTRERHPIHRTLFNMASVVLAIQASGTAFDLLRAADADPITAVARPLVSAAIAYFVVQTWLVAGAAALTSGEGVFQTWHANFLWSAPSYFLAAQFAWVAAWTIRHLGFWMTPLTFAPVYLTYRIYKLHVDRVEAQRFIRVSSDLPLQQSRRWPEQSTRRIRGRTRTFSGCSTTRWAWRGQSAFHRRKFRPSRPRRCCTISASWLSRSTSCRNRGR
jgi:hypothetical protein